MGYSDERHNRLIRVQFTVPSGLSTGSIYQIWVYNGHGGKYGWSENPTELTIGPGPTYSGMIYVTNSPYDATGNGTTDDGPAIEAAIAALSPGETLYFPAGTYRVDGERLVLPSDVTH